jgi:hypothetical protein
MAPAEPEGVFDDVKPLAYGLVAAVSQPAPSLENCSWA